MAQRAIREKTKQRISELEAIIDHLRNSDHNKELQAAILAKEAAEAENADIKRQLVSITATMQDLITPRQPKPEELAYVSPASQACFSTNPLPASASTIVSPPNSATSPAGTLDGHTRDAPQQDFPPSVSQYDRLLDRQRQDMERGLKIGQDRVSLDRLVNLPSNVPGFLSTRGISNRSDADVAGGSQSSYPYHNSPGHYHDNTQRPFANQGSGSFHYHPYSQTTAMQGGSYHSHPAVSPHRPDAYYPPQGEQQIWATPSLHHERTCTMDDILLKLLQERRDLLAQGQPRSAVVGPRYPSVASLLNKDSSPTHPLSDIFIAIIHTFPSLNRLPEQLATVYLMFLIMRWQVELTEESYDRLLPFARPVPIQLTKPHPAWMDMVPFPLMREAMIRNMGEYDIDEFWVPYTNTLSVNWPYDDSYVLIQMPGTGGEQGEPEVTINPVFDQHIRNVENWTVGEAFRRRFPELHGTFKLKEGT